MNILRRWLWVLQGYCPRCGDLMYSDWAEYCPPCIDALFAKRKPGLAAIRSAAAERRKAFLDGTKHPADPFLEAARREVEEIAPTD